MSDENPIQKFRNWVAKLPPLSTKSMCQFYGPLAGAFSYCAFSVTVFMPEVLGRYYPNHSVTIANLLLFKSHIGTSLYIYTRRHLARAATFQRVLYSGYGAVIFNFGSVLLWAVCKSMLPESSLCRSIFAVSSSICLLSIGKEYIDYVDGNSGAGASH